MALLAERVRTGLWESGLALLDRLPVARRPALPAHLEIGRAGEEAALFYLRRCGYTVIAHGWQSGRAPGDLDLVAWEGDMLCFVEVKTRSTRGMATAEAAIDRAKRDTLRRLAAHYLRQMPDGTPARFDVVSVYLTPGKSARKGEFELFRNAFSWHEARV